MPNHGLTDDDWDLLLTRIREQQCLPFLGAGVSISAGADPGLPTGAQLAQSLAEECKYPGADKWDLFRVCQYFSVARDAHAVRKAIVKKLDVAGVQPTAVHQLLAQLPFPWILTTNFDNLMERALESAGKKPRVAVYVRRADRIDLPPPSESEPLVYKLHGTVEQVETLIATEDDVIDFAACLLQDNPELPSLIAKLFETTSLLFIGYGLRDWNVRMMLRALRKRKGLAGPPEIASYAIQRRPQDVALASEWEKSVMYWDRYESLRCFDVDAPGFLRDLVNRYAAAKEGKP
jgi:hypothetical protein